MGMPPRVIRAVLAKLTRRAYFAQVPAVFCGPRYTPGVARRPTVSLAERPAEQVRECDERLSQAFALLGKRWSGVIVGLLLQGPARFAVLARTIPGISERMLSDRLAALSGGGLVGLQGLDGPPLGVLYHLKDRGRAAGPCQLKAWGGGGGVCR